MEYEKIAKAYERIEKTSKRLEMTALLVELLKETPPEIIDKVVYLTQGKLAPDYVGIEFGVAEKLAMRALSLATSVGLSEIDRLYKEKGDLGSVAEHVLSKRRAVSLLDFFGGSGVKRKLTVERVYDSFMKIAKASGEGSQDVKISVLASLLKDASPLEAKYILRTITGRLRLGVADMTILDALAIAFGGLKKYREVIERAYNVHPDLGYIAKIVATKGIEGLKDVKISVGTPILPMLAERLSNPKEILDKLGGKCLAEYKYDGERMQIHKRGEEVIIYSRRLENITYHYPDVQDYVREYVKVNEAILEGECVAIDPDTGDMRPFQELMHRRRKYGIKEAIEKYPVVLYLFDCLYVDGVDYTTKPLPLRRKKLKEVVKASEKVKLSTSRLIENPKDLEFFFEEAISEGCEGIMCKSVNSDAIYQMGARGWLWIKYKRDYKYEMTDTVDLVAVGAFYGRGRRAGTYGALLMAAYDPESDTFKTVCKVGSGFTDEDLAKLPELFKPYTIQHKHPRVDSKIEADVWFVPSVVLEIIGAEITLSPLHTCALNKIREGVGLAIRFPRFTGRYRFDKGPEQATTVKELIEMYKEQRKVKVTA